jgi:hypothetical protein
MCLNSLIFLNYTFPMTPIDGHNQSEESAPTFGLSAANGLSLLTPIIPALARTPGIGLRNYLNFTLCPPCLWG